MLSVGDRRAGGDGGGGGGVRTEGLSEIWAFFTLELKPLSYPIPLGSSGTVVRGIVKRIRSVSDSQTRVLNTQRTEDSF